MQLTKEQINKILILTKILEEGDIAIASYLFELEEKLSDVNGKDGDKGDMGEKGEKGDRGDDYILTDEDKKEIASKIKVPVVEKVIERIETIKEQPIVTKEIKEVALAETPEQIISKINQTKESINLDTIKDLKKRLTDLEKSLVASLQNPIRIVGGSGGGKGVDVLDENIAISQNPSQKINFTGSGVTVTDNGNGVATISIPTILYSTGVIDGMNTQFRFSEKPTIIVADNASYREGYGWSWDSANLTATLEFNPTYDVFGQK